MSDYPVGAKWVAKLKSGAYGCYYLEKRDKHSEYWLFEVYYSDGSRPRIANRRGYSQRSVRDECATELWWITRHFPREKIRFKRDPNAN